MLPQQMNELVRPVHAAMIEAVADDANGAGLHVRLVPRGDHWEVEDLGSKLGTLVDEEPWSRCGGRMGR